MTEMTNTANVDPAELAKFSDLAHRWWDKESEFRPLHEINPLRANYIDEPSPGKVPGDTPGGLSARTKTSGGPVMRTAARSVEMAAGQGLEP